jgi:protein deglycase
MDTAKAAVMIYPQFCIQEICCLTEIFKLHDKEITTFSASMKPVKTEDGFIINPHKTFSQFIRHDYDCIILPGIFDYRVALNNSENISFLSQFRNDNKIIIGSISSSPILLAKAGLLDDHTFCAGLFEEVIDAYTFIPKKNIVRTPIHQDRNLITAIGFAFREFAITIAAAMGIEGEENSFKGIIKDYTEEELIFHAPEDLEIF